MWPGGSWTTWLWTRPRGPLMSTWPWWTPCAPTAPWGPSWSPRLRYCSRTGALALGQALCCALLAYLLPLPLSWSPGGVRGGREAGADLLQEGGAAGDRACGEHERLRLPPLLGESWVVLGVGGQHRPPQGPAHCGQRGWRWTPCLCVPGVHQHLLQGRRRGAGETCRRPLPG